MYVKKIGIPAIMSDNDMNYLSHVIRSLAIIDNEASLIISKSIAGFGFTLRSREDLKDLLLQEIRACHRMLGLEVEVSSYRESPIITFRLLAR